MYLIYKLKIEELRTQSQIEKLKEGHLRGSGDDARATQIGGAQKWRRVLVVLGAEPVHSLCKAHVQAKHHS